jgi:hypothetical protein
MPTKNEIDADCLDRWQLLVSESNWQKGELIATYAANDLFTRDAEFAHQVGQVTAQYVWALRSVYERFSDIRHNYPYLRWTHFYTALNWPDAHVWLRKADVERMNYHEMKAVRFYELPKINREKQDATRGNDGEQD